MMAKGRGATHAARLLPSYPAVVEAALQLCAGLSSRELRRLRVEDLPPCFARQLPQPVRGEAEEYEQFEEAGSTGLVELAILNPASSRAGVSEQSRGAAVLPEGSPRFDAARDQLSQLALRARADYYLTGRSFKERLVCVKGEPCRACYAEPRCPGIWEPYLRRHGFHGFTPVPRD
jgi:hypothetical protein